MKTEQRQITPEYRDVYVCDVGNCAFETTTKDDALYHHGTCHTMTCRQQVGGIEFLFFDAADRAWNFLEAHRNSRYRPLEPGARCWLGPGWYRAVESGPYISLEPAAAVIVSLNEQCLAIHEVVGEIQDMIEDGEREGSPEPVPAAEPPRRCSDCNVVCACASADIACIRCQDLATVAAAGVEDI